MHVYSRTWLVSLISTCTIRLIFFEGCYCCNCTKCPWLPYCHICKHFSIELNMTSRQSIVQIVCIVSNEKYNHIVVISFSEVKNKWHYTLFIMVSNLPILIRSCLYSSITQFHEIGSKRPSSPCCNL